MTIDNDPLTHIVLDQSKTVWGDFLSLFNSEYAMLYFGIGGIVMGVMAQYNSSWADYINKKVLRTYEFVRGITAFVVLVGLILLASYIAIDEALSKSVTDFLSSYPRTVYVFLLCTALIALGLAVSWLNRPYPNLKNNVAGLALALGFIYFLFEVQGVEAVEPMAAITATVIISFVIYYFGDFSTSKEVYLKNELRKNDEKRRLILSHLAELEKEKEKKRRERARANRLHRHRRHPLKRAQRAETASGQESRHHEVSGRPVLEEYND